MLVPSATAVRAKSPEASFTGSGADYCTSYRDVEMTAFEV